MIITVGFSLPDRTTDYIPRCDGYRPGARQVSVDLYVDDAPDGLSGDQWAEAVLDATNYPPTWDDSAAVKATRRALRISRPPYWRLLTTGDTVTVDGVRWARETTGWRKVAGGEGPHRYVPTIDEARRQIGIYLEVAASVNASPDVVVRGLNKSRRESVETAALLSDAHAEARNADYDLLEQALAEAMAEAAEATATVTR